MEARANARIAVDHVQAFALQGIDPYDPYGQPILDLPAEISEKYTMFLAAVAEAQECVAKVDGPVGQKLAKELHTDCEIFLHDLAADDLKRLATEHGFEYASLVAPSEDSKQLLEHWLDPTTDAETKKKIQATAQDRYAALCAGGTVAGKTLAQWREEDPGLGAKAHGLPPGFAPWQASQADIDDAKTGLNHAIATLYATPFSNASEALAQVIAAENKLATAQNPDLAKTLHDAAAAARHQVDQACLNLTPTVLAPAIQAAQANGQITDAEPQVLGPQQLARLLRATTPADHRADLQKLVNQRTELLEHHQAHCDAVSTAIAGTLPAVGTPDAHVAVSKLISSTQQLAEADKVSHWNAVSPPTLPSSQLAGKAQGALEAWAGDQKLQPLRKFVTEAGILTADEASVATTKHLQSALISHAVSGESTKQGLKSYLQKKYDTLHSPQETSKPSPSSPSAAVVAPPRSTFGAQHAQLVHALRQAQATHAALPKYLNPDAVTSWDFGQGQPANLGGTHPKTLHTGPDGATWLAKREGTPRGGAVTQAEAAASRLAAKAGQPAVPVYATKVNGKHVSVQPLLSGAKEMTPSPSSWSQTDVDAVVRLHVTSWVIGNHDAHHQNVLRTSDGGLVPIDQGQAFKNYGQDKLDMHYRPNTTSVFHRAYDAHLASQLPQGVKINPAVAHPVIKQFESIPDSEWRSLLRDTAYAGAAQKQMKWVPPMRARAAKKHGIPEDKVSTTQIAETFLDYSVERKNNLRRDFATFFTQQLKLESATALKHLAD
ncbi:hypothetical protein [Amycolatopsis magusensis]|uniref:hypothetical protein n=1 Tax=Amycolatopsis magusensis TaxID=882444 RepID=UPI0037A310BE